MLQHIENMHPSYKPPVEDPSSVATSQPTGLLGRKRQLKDRAEKDQEPKKNIKKLRRGEPTKPISWYFISKATLNSYLCFRCKLRFTSNLSLKLYFSILTLSCQNFEILNKFVKPLAILKAISNLIIWIKFTFNY